MWRHQIKSGAATSRISTPWAIPGTLLSGTAAGAAIALMATIGTLTGYASPVLIGWISQRTGHVEDGLLALAAITCALSVCAWGLARVMVVASPDSEPALLSSRP